MSLLHLGLRAALGASWNAPRRVQLNKLAKLLPSCPSASHKSAPVRCLEQAWTEPAPDACTRCHQGRRHSQCCVLRAVSPVQANYSVERQARDSQRSQVEWSFLRHAPAAPSKLVP